MLRGRNVFITGASRGIGRAIATVFAENGANLFLNASSSDVLEEYVALLAEEHGVQAHAFPFDVADFEQTKAAFRKLFGLTKKLDVLVNNAGVLDDALIGMVSEKQVRRTFEINTFSLFYTCQYASRLMTRNKQGSIINVSSIIGRTGNEGQSLYAASKAAVIGLTQSLAKELAPANIRVNAIAPGFIDTEMTRGLPKVKYEERLASIKMGRIGQPREVADVALWLASDLSSYVTGQVIGVDGGMLV